MRQADTEGGEDVVEPRLMLGRQCLADRHAP